MPNHLSYFEIRVTDYEKSEKFYSSLFDWEIGKMGEHPYGLINLGKEPMGGLGQNEEGKPSRTIIYFSVDDMDGKLKEIEEAGGKIITPKTLISEEYGYFSHFSDPDGNFLGLASST